jgi:succinate dehydrogenase subunit C
MSSEASTSPRTATKTYRPAMAAGWWTRKRNYFLYMVREFTALPLALWLLWLLYEIQRAGRGPSHFYAPSSMPFIVFSVICLLFALYHSFTFLRLAGVILHVKVLDKPVPSGLIVASQFGAWLVASIVIGAVLIGFGR